MKNPIQIFLALAFTALTSSLNAQSYPLSENTWTNPEFVDRFMGSFGVDTNKSPSVTKEEGAVFRQVSQVASSNPREAIRLLQGMRNAESSAAVDFALANFQLQEGNFSGAEASYKTAISKFPNFGRAYKNLGLAYIQQGKYPEALPHLTKSLEILGGDGGLFGLIGFCHLNSERFGPALDAYRLALVYQPDSRDWRLGQLKALQNLRQYEDVENIIYRYIEEKPSEPEFWLQQANAFIAQRKYDKAAANFEIVDILGGADNEMYILLGDLYVNLNAPSLAMVPYNKAIASGEVKPEKALNIAGVMSRRLSPTDLKKFLDKIDAAYQSNLSQENELLLLTLQAANAFALNDKANAMSILTKVVARDPLNGRALLTLGNHFAGEEDFEKSLDYFSRAEKVEDFKVDALIGSARVLVKQNKYQAAVNKLKEAQFIDDQSYIAQYINTLEKFIN